MHTNKLRGVLAPIVLGISFYGCGNMTAVQMGDDSARTLATGSAGGATSQHANAQLQHCDKLLGTLAVVEDHNSHWYYELTREYKLTSTVPLIRLLVQQSNCFVVVERGRAFDQMQTERALNQAGELRQGSNFGARQVVAADYSLNPMISFSQKDAGGLGSALSVLPYGIGVLGALAGNLQFREAATTLTLVDNRSGIQLAAAEGSSSKTDFGALAGIFGSAGGGILGGYTNTAEGKLLVAAFADTYNRLVSAVKNYKAQQIEDGPGTGGALGVQGGSTAASKDLEVRALTVAPKPASKPAAKSAPKTAPAK
jgi:curli biogenesis system outer membrane secretion channel CsgG